MKWGIFWTVMVFGAFTLLPGSSCLAQTKKTAMTVQENLNNGVRLFLCGDVMTGRGIDQVLPHSTDPVLYESYVKDARDYVRLAERFNGKINFPVSFDYIWGDALEVWEENLPHLKLINLETSITTHNEPWPGKGINYRMHPNNIKVLTAAGIDHCSLANNHTLDWGRQGLEETMQVLKSADIGFSGVGKNKQQSEEAFILNTPNGRVLVFSYGSRSSGIPDRWAAEPGLSGVNLLPDLKEKTLKTIKQQVEDKKEPGDIVIFSVHWGSNWGYSIPERHREFSHQLIDQAGVDVIFGHSSHHPLGIEVYNGKLIIYGAGDFINDYEGISGKEEYRGELTLMYFPELDPVNGHLKTLKMVPMKVKKFRLNRADSKNAAWLKKTLDREGKFLGTSIRMDTTNALWLEW